MMNFCTALTVAGCELHPQAISRQDLLEMGRQLSLYSNCPTSMGAEFDPPACRSKGRHGGEHIFPALERWKQEDLWSAGCLFVFIASQSWRYSTAQEEEVRGGQGIV